MQSREVAAEVGGKRAENEAPVNYEGVELTVAYSAACKRVSWLVYGLV